MSEYLTIISEATGEYIEQRSKFISNIIPVTTEAEALDFISQCKKKYWDANHNVYAYIIQEEALTRFSDDGEPHSTAGLPSLEVLKNKGLSNVCIVTTRYFGGVLLGTGGLVRAYTAAAQTALESAEIAVMRQCDCCSITVPYGDYKKLEQCLRDEECLIGSTEFTDNVSIEFFSPVGKKEHLQNILDEIFCGNLRFIANGMKFLPFKV